MIENVINFYKLNEHWLCKLVFCLSLLFSFSFLFLLPFLVSSFCRPLVSSSPLGKVFTNTPRIYKYFKDSTWVLVNQFFFLWMTQDLIILFGHDVSGTRNMHLNCFNDSQTLIILSKRSNTKKVKTNKHSHLFCKKFLAFFHCNVWAIPWVPETFHARFPVSVMSLLWHSDTEAFLCMGWEKVLWSPGYVCKDLYVLQKLKWLLFFSFSGTGMQKIICVLLYKCQLYPVLDTEISEDDDDADLATLPSLRWKWHSAMLTIYEVFDCCNYWSKWPALATPL